MLGDLPWRWRDRIVGDRRFQRLAARFPLTRPIARQRTRSLFNLAAGFVHAQVLAACVQLDLFALLAEGPRSLADLTAATGLPADGMQCLLTAACGLGLLQQRGPGGALYGLGTQGAALRGNPGIAAMVRHHALLYDDLRDPLALLRANHGPALGNYWGYAAHAAPAGLADDRVAPYTALMAVSQPMIADEVTSAYDFSRHGCLLDVGGGDGSFVQAVAARAPALQLMLMDLPAVATAAANRLRVAGIGALVDCVGGDFRTQPFPRGADIVTFVRVLHDHDDATLATLLAAARVALPVGGTVLIAEPMADDGSAAAYFSIYLHAMGSGRPRRADELAAMLRAAGFDQPRVLATPTPLLARVITAQCKS